MFNESYWQTLIEAVPVAVVVFQGEDLKVIGCSSRQLAYWGKAKNDVLNRPAADLLSSERVGVLKEVLGTGNPVQDINVKFEFERNGIPHTGIYDYIYQPWADETGDIQGVIAVIHDVTQSRYEKQQVGILSRNILHLANAMPQLVWIATPDGTVTYYNDRLSLFHGASRLPDGSWSWDGLLHQKDLDHTINVWTEALRTGEQYQAEHRIMMADKSFRWHLSRALPEKDEHGKIVQWYGTATDIHDVKIAQEELRKKEKRLRLSENNFRKLAHALPQMIWTTDNSGDPDFYNDRWYAYTGASPKDSLEYGWRSFVHSEHIETINAILSTSVTGAIGTSDHDLRIRDKSGNYSWFNLLVTPVYDEHDNYVKLIGTFTNIDERKSMEEQLKQLVEQRTQELERSNQDLTQFAHITSHDLKEPLRKMKTFGLRLKEESGHELQERGQLYLSKILQSAERLSAMVDGILEYSQLNSKTLNTELVDMNALLEDILQDFELVIREKNADVKIENLHNVKGARIQLRQLFYNLINNALKFSKPGVAPAIEIHSRTSDDRLAVSYQVKDNGIGFDPEYSERIFETFYRLHPKDLYEGTGLGLALCRKVAMRHGGNLTAFSDGATGSLFTVTLPLKANLQ